MSPFLGSPNGQSTVENRAGAGTRSEGAQWLDSDWGIFEGTLFSEEVGKLSSGSATSKPCPWASHGPFLDLCSPLKWVDWTLQDDPRPKVPLDSNVLTIPTQIPESACGQGDQRLKRQKNLLFPVLFCLQAFCTGCSSPWNASSYSQCPFRSLLALVLMGCPCSVLLYHSVLSTYSTVLMSVNLCFLRTETVCCHHCTPSWPVLCLECGICPRMTPPGPPHPVLSELFWVFLALPSKPSF